ncbi:hypothetical protein N9003_01450 [bacterium]|nr:hypothetical protein [bacterium]
MQIERNPYSTCFTKPGKLSFIFPDSRQPDSLLTEFERNGFQGQIVGPHGCGKTTLTMTLEAYLVSNFAAIRRITVRKDGKVSSGIRQENQQDSNRSTLFVIDGIENMPWLHRKVFLKFIQTSAGGLLLTTHRAFKGIPVIYQITPSFIIFSNIVSHISPDHVIYEQRLKSIFIQNNYSIRESLMSLYTIWEEDRQRFIPVRDTQSA